METFLRVVVKRKGPHIKQITICKHEISKTSLYGLQTFGEKNSPNNFMQNLLKLYRTGIDKILKFKRNRRWER